MENETFDNSIIVEAVLSGLGASRPTAIKVPVELQVSIELQAPKNESNLFRVRVGLGEAPDTEGQSVGDEAPIEFWVEHTMRLQDGVSAAEYIEAAGEAAVFEAAWPYARSALHVLTGLTQLPPLPLPFSSDVLRDWAEVTPKTPGDE
jgi:hypothetical protein